MKRHGKIKTKKLGQTGFHDSDVSGSVQQSLGIGFRLQVSDTARLGFLCAPANPNQASVIFCRLSGKLGQHPAGSRQPLGTPRTDAAGSRVGLGKVYLDAGPRMNLDNARMRPGSTSSASRSPGSDRVGCVSDWYLDATWDSNLVADCVSVQRLQTESSLDSATRTSSRQQGLYLGFCVSDKAAAMADAARCSQTGPRLSNTKLGFQDFSYKT